MFAVLQQLAATKALSATSQVVVATTIKKTALNNAGMHACRLINLRNVCHLINHGLHIAPAMHLVWRRLRSQPLAKSRVWYRLRIGFVCLAVHNASQ